MKESKFLPSFARQRTRGANTEQKKFLKEVFLPSNMIDLQNLNPPSKKIIIEIGSGNGETAVNYAFLNPEIFYIASEVFFDGLLQTASKVYTKKIENIKFWKDDARILLSSLQNGIIDKIFLFFPDPWPKKRHHKRRILNEEFLKLAFSKLQKNGQILTATDHELYKNHIIELGNSQKYFSFKEESFPDWWTQTKYQKKAILEGRSASFFTFTKF